METMIKENFVFPFDFELFKHQLTTEEVLAIVDIVHQIAIAHCRGPECYKIILDSAIVNLRIANAKLYDPLDHRNNIYSVLNGLLSGMNET